MHLRGNYSIETVHNKKAKDYFAPMTFPNQTNQKFITHFFSSFFSSDLSVVEQDRKEIFFDASFYDQSDPRRVDRKGMYAL